MNCYNLNYHVEGTKPAPSPQVFNVETNRVEPNLVLVSKGLDVAKLDFFFYERSFFHISLKELNLADKIMTRFLEEAKLIVDTLAFVGLPMSNQEFNANIFRLLPHEYHPIIAAIYTHKDHVAFHELSGQLIVYEVLLKSSIH